jgi:hypothetical protein
MNDSYALPSSRYGDPADIVEVDQMDALGCRLCASHTFVLNRVMCVDSRNEMQKRVPYIGHRCKWFIEKG